ncbi:MAG: glyoxylate reductase [Solirubrobacteraceae bacterium]|nr:glyoxylate reductase [Solirubrobacteraceae bacterium]MEA2384013.1 glyoxylate reductase [Solirubrobacteraceae bacterium]
MSAASFRPASTSIARRTRPRIVVTRRLPEAALELVRAAGDVWVSPHDRPLTPDELRAAMAGADAALTLLHDRVDEELLDAAGPRLRCVANVAAGYDNVDVAAASRRGVVVTNTPGVLTDATADLAIALMLMVTRRLGEGERLIRGAVPWSWDMHFMLGQALRDKVLGIVGLGEIGRATARRARAFGMEILYTGRRRAPEEIEDELGARMVDRDELFAAADVVSLHCPLTPETRRLVDAAHLARMHSGAYLVNTSRGGLVDEAALVEALRDRAIAGAALDVFEFEPAVHPGLLELDNAVLIPHLGSATVETRTAMATLAARNAVAVLRDEAPPTPLNISELRVAPASGRIAVAS